MVVYGIYPTASIEEVPGRDRFDLPDEAIDTLLAYQL
jgi:hypothetical protein